MFDNTRNFWNKKGFEAPLCESSHSVILRNRLCNSVGLRAMGIISFILAFVCKTVLGVGLESDGEALTDFRVQALGIRRSSLCVSVTARVDPTWLDTHLRDWATLTV